MLKRSPSLTEQAKSLIKQRIINAEFEEGRIPSEMDLAEELGVSRTTIRDALSRLELEGVIYRKQGAGTFVNKAGLQIKSRLEDIWSYAAMIEAHGYKPQTRIVSLDVQPAAPPIATDLNRPPGEPLLVVKKLFLADERPVIMTVNYLPEALIEQPYNADDFQRPLYEFLAERCHQPLAYYLSEIVPLTTPPWLVTALQLPAPRALLSFEETGYNQENEPVVRAFSYFRDDLLRLRLIRREGT